MCSATDDDDLRQFRGWDVQVPDDSWDIERLRHSLSVVVPAEIAKAPGFEGDRADLPFPTWLVQEISDDDIALLAEVFELAEGEQRYTSLRQAYFEINFRYIANNEIEVGAKIAEILKCKTDPSILPVVFFLLAFAILIQESKKLGIEERAKGRIAVTKAEANRSAAEIKKAVASLSAKISRAEPCLFSETAEARVQVILDELASIVAEEERAFNYILARYNVSAYKYLPNTNKVSDTADFVHRAVDKVAELISQTAGRKDRSVNKATKMAALWGLHIDQGALKTARSRRRKL